jgi:ABC-type nitrate/sulfonate/bicarbonate transport system substrate-binding protein
MKLNLPRLSLLLCLSLASAVSFAQDKLTELKWGHITATAFYWDTFAAIDAGYMSKEDLKITPVRVDAASQSIQLLLTGAVDILSSNPELALNAIDKGAQLSIIGAEATQVSWALMVRPEITDYAGLKGKVIGVTQLNDASTRMVVRLLAKHGLQKGDYEMIQLGGTPNRYAALQKGAVQAAALAQPADFIAEAAGMRRLGFVSEAFQGPAIVYVARKDWLKEHGDLAKKFLRAANNGAKWLYDPANKDAALKVLARHINAKETEARLTYDMYIVRDKVISTNGVLPLQHVQNYLDAKAERTGASPASYTDFSYLDKTAK